MRLSSCLDQLLMYLMPGPQPERTLDIGMAKSALQSRSPGGLPSLFLGAALISMWWIKHISS